MTFSLATFKISSFVGFQQFKWLCVLGMFVLFCYLSSLVFSVILGFLVWCLLIIVKFSAMILSNISVMLYAFSSPSKTTTTNMFDCLILSHSSWIFCNVYFAQCFSLNFDLVHFYLPIFQLTDCLLGCVKSNHEQVKGILHLLICFLS